MLDLSLRIVSRLISNDLRERGGVEERERETDKQTDRQTGTGTQRDNNNYNYCVE